MAVTVDPRKGRLGAAFTNRFIPKYFPQEHSPGRAPQDLAWGDRLQVMGAWQWLCPGNQCYVVVKTLRMVSMAFR
jgi:hypothetical protein